MEIGKLTVSTREGIGKGVARQLRMKGLVPGVCYGAGIDVPQKIVVDPKVLKASLDPEKRQNTVIEVTIEGSDGPRTVTAMLWDYQIHPIKRLVTHVDLKAIDPNVTVEANVPVELLGKAAGLVNGGQLNVARHEITISAKPGDIPARFELDVTDLDLGDVRHVSDLVVPAGVELVSSTKLTIVTCLAPKTTAADDEAEAAAAEAAAEAEAAEGATEGGDAAPKKEGDA